MIWVKHNDLLQSNIIKENILNNFIYTAYKQIQNIWCLMLYKIRLYYTYYLIPFY